MKRAVVIGLSLLFVLLAVSLTAAGGVRATRDSPIIIHGHVQQPGTFDSSRISSPQISLLKLRCPEPYRLDPKPSPGFGPVWVPASPCWNGSQIVEVPGHWVR